MLRAEMPCDQCFGIEQEFDGRVARREQRDYRRKGAPSTTRLLIEGLQQAGVEGRSVLDIGGGVGAVQHALLTAGASRAQSVDASSAYLEVARQEAERLGWAGRIEAVHGDFVRLASAVAAADIVTLDRVICCYDDMRSLVRESARRARRLYGLVYPRDAWWLRPAFGLMNLFLRIRRSSFRTFLHPTTAVESELAQLGLTKVFHRNSGMWQVAVFSV
jgi:magnesium-protoporphyrin O-methyltransferase